MASRRFQRIQEWGRFQKNADKPPSPPIREGEDDSGSDDESPREKSTHETRKALCLIECLDFAMYMAREDYEMGGDEEIKKTASKLWDLLIARIEAVEE